MNRARVMVAAFAGLPWLRRMATALSSANLLARYVTPIAMTVETERWLDRWLPERVSRPLLAQLRLRPRPEGVEREQVRTRGTAAELMRVAAVRASAPEGVIRFLRLRSGNSFDRSVKRLLTGDELAVTAYLGTARATLRRARQLGVKGILDYPIAHHSFSEQLLQEEARLKPDWAPTLQFHTLSPRMRSRLEDEIELADRILVLSSFHRRTFVEAGVPESKLVTAPVGVDVELFRPQRRPVDGPFRVLFTGQITQRKGLSYLLDGFEAAKLPDSELILRGRAVGRSNGWSARPNIRHLPPIPHYELPDQYASAKVLVLPSLVESFGLTALEAMACGVPVIVSEHTFGTDVITDGVEGYVVPIRDSGAIAERLRHLYDNPSERERMGIAARRRAQQFTWEHHGERIVQLVRDLSVSV